MLNSSPSEVPGHPARTARWGPWKLNAHPTCEPSRVKVLLLHGFATSPRELRPLGLALSLAGFSSLAPLLPGHGESAKGMRSVVLEDWLEAVRLSYQALRRDGSPVAVVGFCLGGTLTLATAPELNPRGLIALSAPTQPFPAGLFPKDEKSSHRSTSRFLAACRSEKARSWRVAGAHPAVTESFLQRFEEAKAQARSGLSRVRGPVLLVQGGRDSLLPVDHAQSLISQLPPDSESSVFLSEDSDYPTPIDSGRLKVFGRVVDFLRTVAKLEEQRF